ncbi:SMI1/KNR4 family protein [Neobacillus sp. YIM B06451]|uniref:SMI1/KNR4 family protein n=1 Tax=Neobacillus sp. YIM B06451 TaxID=3070994 RepID=UPI00292EFB11|nr:SMI1/KNR4 family protein [Neobacillus sp. YIM B06451]
MSWDTYQRAIYLMEQYEEECDFVGARSDELISKAEDALGFLFLPIYRDFLKKYGAGSFGSQEFYGVIDDDFKNSTVPDAIWCTLTEREDSNLPNHLLVIYDTGMGELICLDFKKINEVGEPQVVSYFPGFDLDKQDFTVVAHDFGDFLLDMVNRELSYGTNGG